MVTVLAFEPHLGSTCLIGAAGTLTHDAFQTQPADVLENLRAISFEVLDELQAVIATI